MGSHMGTESQDADSQRLRIAIVSQYGDRVTPPRMNSVGICSRFLARALASRCAVRVYGVSDTGEGQDFTEADGVRYRLFEKTRHDARAARFFTRTRRFHKYLNRGLGIPAWSSPLIGGRYAAMVARDLARDPVDAVLVQHSATPVAPIRRMLPDLPVILHLHAPLSPQALSRGYRRKLGMADAISAVSRFVAAHTERLLGGKAHVIRNGCDLGGITGHGLSGAHRETAFVYAGAVSPEKGIHVLVDAFNLVSAERPDVRLEIVGPIGSRTFSDVYPQKDDPFLASVEPLFRGDYKALLLDRIAPHARARVSFRGFIPWESLLDEIARARVFVFPSICDEGFGLPPVEAMALGTVPIVSDGGGLPEVVADGINGFVVEKGNAEALAEAMLRLTDDGPLWERMSAESRARAASDYSWDRAADDLLEVVRQLEQAGRRSAQG